MRESDRTRRLETRNKQTEKYPIREKLDKETRRQGTDRIKRKENYID